ncbi:MAG: UDP-3-O-(3-hydroxymyristoyl)glucosamine N-acyltransferase [Thermoplasmatota archaeon]
MSYILKAVKSNMRLSDLKKGRFEIIADGEFRSLGLISHNQPKQMVYIENESYLSQLVEKSNISCVITTKSISKMIEGAFGIIVSDNPCRTFYEIHNTLVSENFYWKPFRTTIARSATVHPTAWISRKNVRIGKNCRIGPNVTILENTILKDNVVLGPGCTLASDGFQFKRFGKGIMPIAHGGGVLLHNRVELQANCSVSRALFGGFTEIGEDSKFANLVHIAHNVRIGKRCLAAACSMFMGSCTVGDDVWVGPAAAISSEVVVGDGASITIGSVVTKDVPPKQRVTGNFAIEHEKFIKHLKEIR